MSREPCRGPTEAELRTWAGADALGVADELTSSPRHKAGLEWRSHAQATRLSTHLGMRGIGSTLHRGPRCELWESTPAETITVPRGRAVCGHTEEHPPV